MRYRNYILLSTLILLLFPYSALADLSEGTFPLDTGKWQLKYRPGVSVPYVESRGNMESDTGQWRILDADFYDEPQLLGVGYSSLYQYAVMSITLFGKTYNDMIVTNGEWRYTINSSDQTFIKMEDITGTGTAYIQENGVQYKLDFSFACVETGRVTGDYAEGDVTGIQVTISTIPLGITEGHWDSVSSTPLLELGYWQTEVHGFYPSYTGSIASAHSTDGQWSVTHLIYGSSELSGPGRVEVPVGEDTYIYETYTVPVYGGSWWINFNGKRYRPKVSGTIEWTGIWINAVSESTFTGLTGIVGKFTSIIEEYGVKYECNQTVQYEYGWTGLSVQPEPAPAYYSWSHWGNITRIDLDIKAITPQTIEADSPILIDPSGTDTYNAGIEVANGDFAGAKIIYNTNTDTVQPTFYVTSTSPVLWSFDDTWVNMPLNLLPHGATFVTPVRIFIPCPGIDDVSKLSIYYYSEENEWVKACSEDGTVLLTDWMVPGSRVNHNEMEPKSIEIKINHFSAVQTAKTTAAKLAVDFDSNGLYAFRPYPGSGTWRRLSSWNPEGLTAYDTNLAVDFGSSGLYTTNGISWQRLSSWNPEGMTEWTNGLAVDFGNNGFYTRNGTSWSRLSSWNSMGAAVWEKGLAVNFGPNGLYIFDGQTWQKLSSWTPEDMVPWVESDPITPEFIPDWWSGWSTSFARSGNLAVDFGSNGLYYIDKFLTWHKLSSWNPEGIAGWGDSVYNSDTGSFDFRFGIAVDFGDNGLYFYNFYTSSWNKISNWNAENITTCLFGKILVVDFGVNGLWSTHDGNSWTVLSGNNPINIQPLEYNMIISQPLPAIAVDFGTEGGGLFTCESVGPFDPEYPSNPWTKISNWSSNQFTYVGFE